MMENQLFYSIFALFLALGLLFAGYYFISSFKFSNSLNKTIIAKNNFENLSKKANDLILAIDILYGSIYHVNNKTEELLGYSNEELLKMTIHDLHPKSLLELSSKTIAEVWDRKGLVYQNLPFLCSNGELIDVECSAKVLNYDDKPVIVIYARDIRERLKMEQEIALKNELIVRKNKNITDSINYASRIQQAILGKSENLDKLFKESFVLFKPHSIVSGDFYWFNEIDKYKIVVAADCTGHGVPGAFMTVLGHDFLEDIISNQRIFMPDKILSKLDIMVSKRLRDEISDFSVDDGMDIAILVFDQQNEKIFFSGAKNPLLMIKNGVKTEIKASKHTIGGRIIDKTFDLHKFDYEPDTVYYMFSDGFQDQFGGSKNRKFLVKHFRELLLNISDLDLKEQKLALNSALEQWKGENHQTDDILVIGIKN